MTKDGTKALFRVLGGKKTIDAVEPHLTFALHVTVDPRRQEEDPCVLLFLFIKLKINYLVDFSVHKSQYVKNEMKFSSSVLREHRKHTLHKCFRHFKDNETSRALV